MKKFLSVFLAAVLLMSAAPLARADGSFYVSDLGGGILGVTLPSPDSGTLLFHVHDGTEVVASGRVQVSGTTYTEIGMPVRSLQNGTYNVRVTYVSLDGSVRYSSTVAATFGTDTPSHFDPPDIYNGFTEAPRAVMIPYASIYSGTSLSGAPAVQVKRHDLVEIIASSSAMAEVRYLIPGGGEISGVMPISAFELPSTSIAAEIPREVIEVAYACLENEEDIDTRLSTLLNDWDVVRWLYSQVDIDTPHEAADITAWLASGVDIIWQAEEDPDAVQELIDSITTEGEDDEGILDSLLDNLNSLLGNIGITSDEAEGEAITFTAVEPDAVIDSEDVMAYADSVTSEIISLLRPGDILFFNNKRRLEYDEQELGLWATLDDAPLGIDNTAIFTGCSVTGGMNVIEYSASGKIKLNTINLTPTDIDCADWGQLTIDEICLIVRPT